MDINQFIEQNVQKLTINENDEDEDNVVDKADEEIEDLMCDAQDAFFDQKYEEAIRISEMVIKKKPKESSSYELLINCLLLKEDYDKVLEMLKTWKNFCGESTNYLYHLLKVAYMLEDIDLLEDVLGKFRFLLNKTKEVNMWLRGIVLGVAFCADLGCGVDDQTNNLALSEETEENYPILRGKKNFD